MSCTEIFAFDIAGNAHEYCDIRNAWRGAMAVWRKMEEEYLPPKIFYGQKISRLMGLNPKDADEIWDLFSNTKVPEHERIVLGTTFDKCLVRKEDIPKVIEAFRKFGGETSLPEQADVLEKLLGDDNCIAVGWNQNSVCDSFWIKYNEETDTYYPYNFLAMNEHWWLFDDLKSEDNLDSSQYHQRDNADPGGK